MEKNIVLKIEEAEKIIRFIDHLIYVPYPLINEPKIFIRCLEELSIAIRKIISCILIYESFFNRIKIYENHQKNFSTFFEKCAPKYQITKIQIQQIKELFEIVDEHNKSQIEFKRNENYVILNNSKIKIINLEKVKEFIFLSKFLISKTNEIFRKV